MGKSPINWFGGKYYMTKKIMEHFSDHKIYVEVFGGGGHVLFAKPPSEIEVYNDIDSGLVAFFRILRDEEKSQILIEKLQLTPFSREEFEYCRDRYEFEKDEIEKVRMWYVRLMQSFSSNMSSWKHSKSKSRRGMSQAVSQWLGHVECNLLDAVERLRTVQVEKMDCIELIKKYDSIDTLFYLDPPYVHSTRKMTYEYEYEMEDFQHKQLVETLLQIKGMAILSGYDNSIYDKLLKHGWEKHSIGTYAKRSMKTVGTEKETAEEIIWVKK